MNREQRRRDAKNMRAAPVTRTRVKERALAFWAGLAIGVALVLATAAMVSAT